MLFLIISGKKIRTHRDRRLFSFSDVCPHWKFVDPFDLGITFLANHQLASTISWIAQWELLFVAIIQSVLFLKHATIGLLASMLKWFPSLRWISLNTIFRILLFYRWSLMIIRIVLTLAHKNFILCPKICYKQTVLSLSIFLHLCKLSVI